MISSPVTLKIDSPLTLVPLALNEILTSYLANDLVTVLGHDLGTRYSLYAFGLEFDIATDLTT
jgi:hypothetical protein